MAEVSVGFADRFRRLASDSESKHLGIIREWFGKGSLAAFILFFGLGLLIFLDGLNSYGGPDLVFTFLLWAFAFPQLRAYALARNRLVLPTHLLAIISLSYLSFFWYGVTRDYPHDPDGPVYRLFSSLFGLLALGVAFELALRLKGKRPAWLEAALSCSLNYMVPVILLAIIYKSMHAYL